MCIRYWSHNNEQFHLNVTHWFEDNIKSLSLWWSKSSNFRSKIPRSIHQNLGETVEDLEQKVHNIFNHSEKIEILETPIVRNVVKKREIYVKNEDITLLRCAKGWKKSLCMHMCVILNIYNALAQVFYIFFLETEPPD